MASSCKAAQFINAFEWIVWSVYGSITLWSSEQRTVRKCELLDLQYSCFGYVYEGETLTIVEGVSS